MKRKILTGALVCAVAAGMLSGCGPKQQANTGGETKTLSYWTELASGASSLQSLNEVTMFQELEKRTGIHIDFIHPPIGQAEEQFSLMVASREFPDMISYNWINYPGGPDKAIDANVIVSLNDLIDGNAPNFKSWAAKEEYARDLKTDSGKYFGFPAINTGDYRIFGGPCLRGDWLKELGLAIPETIDEWDTVLRAFKEKKGASAPLTGDIGMFNWMDVWNSGFDVGIRLYVEDGTVKYGPAEPGFKAFLTKFHEWYADGILDMDYPTNNGALLTEKLTNGESGAAICYIGGSIGAYMTMMKDKDPNYEMVAAPHPTAQKGTPPRFMTAEYDVEKPFLAVTTACADTATAVKWIDNFYSEEGRMLVNFGVEGDTYNMVDGKPVYTDKILHSPEGYSIAEAMCRNFQASYPTTGLKQDENYLNQYYQYPQQTDALNLWAANVQSGKTTQFPRVTPTLDESEEVATLGTEISTYVDEMVLKFVQGTEPLSNYDVFLENLQKLNLNRYLELQQAAYDRYLQR